MMMFTATGDKYLLNENNARYVQGLKRNGEGGEDFMDVNSYLDAHAAKLRSEFPMCGGYIVELLAKYKNALKEDLVDIGSSPDEVLNNFENDIRKHCLRASE